MYIQDTTQHERVIISQALDGAFNNVARAHRLLSRVWDDYFGMREQPDIPGHEAEYLGELLYAIVDKLNFMAFDREKQLKPELREALCQERAEICKLPDEEAEPLLRDILNREGECEA